LLKNKVQKM